MGLLKHLLFWPVTGPTFLTRFALDKVGDTVHRELTDDEAIREDLLALQMRLELGELDDEEYVREEAVLMERLREVRAWREELGMATPGGPVRVAGSREGDSSISDPSVRSDPSSVSSPDDAEIEIRLDRE